MPPQVQDLNSLIGQYTSALKPQQDQIDTEIAANNTSGAVQQQGLDAKKTQAFGDITQSANDRGGYFSGFTPDAQAKYTAATYLPALAQLQNTIASTRSSLLGKKADLNASANTSALTELNSEKSAYQQWQDEQAKIVAAAAEAEKGRQFEAGQNALNRSASAAAAGAKAAAEAAKASQASFNAKKLGSGNWAFTTANGQPVNLANYLNGIGGGVQEANNILANGSNYDKAIYNKVKSITDPNSYQATVGKLDKQNFYGFR